MSQTPVPVELRADVVKAILRESSKMEGYRKTSMEKQLLRNGRWGTCVCCPRDAAGDVYPERCEETKRYDHWLGTNYKIVHVGDVVVMLD